MRGYTGPRDTNDFDNLDPDQAARELVAYKLLGDAFEDEDADGMSGRGWLLDDPLQLVQGRREQLARAERELHASVRLARHQGIHWTLIAKELGADTAKVIERFKDAGE